RYSEPPRAAHYRRARIGVEAVSGGPATARVALAGLAADALVACGHEALGLVSASPFALEAAAQSIHEVHHLALGFFRFGGDQLLALLLARDQLTQRVLVAILELARIELGLPLRDDLLGNFEHARVGFGQPLVEHR